MRDGRRIRDNQIGFVLDSFQSGSEQHPAPRLFGFVLFEELAGFFFFYCVYHTLEAARALDEPARGRHLEKFRAQILALPEMDGSFVDSHELGKSYGTAMALLILNRLR